MDLVTQNIFVPSGQAGERPNVVVLLNSGDGTFGAYTNLTVPTPPNNFGTTQNYGTGSGDLNGDGKQDLVLGISDGYGDSDAIILLGNGDGTFQSPNYLSLPSQPIVPPYFVLQDVDLDGHLDLVFGSGTLALGNGDGTFTLGTPLFPANKNYPYAPLQISLAGNQVPSLSFLSLPTNPPVPAVFTPQTSSSAGFSATTLAVGTHTISARYSGDTNYAAGASAGVLVTVNQAASATAPTSSANPSFAGQSVTLTAIVTSNGPKPTGDLTFSSGSTTLSTIALTGGSAAYTTSSFTTVGTQTITASYSGDANTQTSSATLSQVVNSAFTLAPGANGNTSLTVQSGQSVNSPINVTGAAGFSGQVTFACSGLPANASCSFSPATITVAGTPAVPTLLTVNTASSATTSHIQEDGILGTATGGFALTSMLLFWPERRRWSMRRITLCSIAAVALLMTVACGGGGGSGSAGSGGGTGGSPTPPATAPGTYTFLITATSGNVTVDSTYVLTVQ